MRTLAEIQHLFGEVKQTIDGFFVEDQGDTRLFYEKNQVAGGIEWKHGTAIDLRLGAGYAFGNVPIVKNNFSLVALGIVAVSLIPVAVEWWTHRKKGQRV